MITKRLVGLGTAAALALGLGACVDDYGYGGMEVGYGTGYYGDPYYGGYGYDGYGYAPSYYGWYGDFYYPGTGIYVYDQYRRPYRWNDAQRRYWSAQQRYRSRDGNGSGSWNGFDRRIPPSQFNGQRQWQRGPNGDAPGTRQWQQSPGGVVPPAQGYRNPGAQRYRGNPGNRTYTARPPQQQTFTPPPPPQRSTGERPARDPGRRSARGNGRFIDTQPE